jgi:glycosyltransferase involved in cell wall biosynthesis
MNVGGPAVLLSELVHGLPASEIKHTLITGRCEANEIDYLETHKLNSDVIYLEKVRRSLLPFSDFRSFFELIAHIKRLNPDVIHTHTSKAGVLGRIAGKIGAPRAKIIHTYHGHLLYGYFSHFATRLIILLEKFLSLITDDLVAVTNQVRDDLIDAGIGSRNRWHVIRPGLSVPTMLSRDETRKQLEVGDNTFVVAWIGRFTDIKDPLLAIRSLEALDAHELARVNLVMAGDGELLAECREYADSRKLPVIFMGWCLDVSPLLFASDLLLMSSKNEGMPVVIVEAALRGVPTLSTSVGGVGEFIEDGKTGFMAKNSSELASSLQNLLNNEAVRIDVANSARNLATTEFSRELFIAKHLELYRAKKV